LGKIKSELQKKAGMARESRKAGKGRAPLSLAMAS